MGKQTYILLTCMFVSLMNGSRVPQPPAFSTRAKPTLEHASFRMLPQVNKLGICKPTSKVIVPSSCLCYMIVSKRLKVRRVKSVLEVCKLAGSKKFIRSLSFACASFRDRKGTFQQTRFSKSIRAIVKKCFPGTPPFQIA